MRTTAVESFKIADQSNQDLRTKLAEEEWARISAESDFNSTQKQVADQRLLLHEAKE